MSLHAGFDSMIYPGDDFMQLLWDNTNLAWTAFYLAPAPSQPYPGWMNKVQILSGMGWGFAPLYVGQQAQGPGSKILTSLQGVFDAINAASLAQKAQFPAQSVIYLDMEQGPPLQQPAIDYYGAWVQGLFDQGIYPGVYCSFLLAAQLMAIDARPIVWTYKIAYPKKAYRDPLPTPDPSNSGYYGASIWQFAQGCSIQVQDSGSALRTFAPVDFDSAGTTDPSVNIFAS